MKTFGEKLKELRLEQNLTIIELGEKIGVRHITISRWERDLFPPNIYHLYNIAKYFKVSADYLIGLED